ncbi:hypothetical protein MKK70_14710 [Methylobacterium sp. E-041]|jgi:hypothetical protein|uniref:hypothetical protein n=1 Tax=unclassified Methylobacterium TaxID=2615210 RepID=UPI0011CAB5BE|nr:MULTISPECIES: hypothetical protein [unclassified Methylobacterium]RZK92037.1 MAG: hypothetical protein EOO66_10930 [Methylobacterium sp.]MCJ2008533.1 hypothetical protein [Methylobacterium sp. J-092]MCJ2041777.1 hypothetical protein [Methylobacterium sp. J-059]MCJ2074525.1 hypothetical protein [Methylobacterium sp. E-016]MCJ2106608.1 hypothetical protein [Methylobacterium sp. E-041]
MTKITTFAGAAALVLMSSAAFAAPCSTGTTVTPDKDASKASTVDPKATANTSPGAKGESPGTVGAMNKAGSAAGATSPADVNAQDKGNPTAAQAAKNDC